MVKLYFLGTDKRSRYLNEMYKENANETILITNDLNEADIVIAPIPFSKDRVHVTGESIDVLDLLTKCKGKPLISGAMKAFKRRIRTF